MLQFSLPSLTITVSFIQTHLDENSTEAIRLLNYAPTAARTDSDSVNICRAYKPSRVERIFVTCDSIPAEFGLRTRLRKGRHKVDLHKSLSTFATLTNPPLPPLGKLGTPNFVITHGVQWCFIDDIGGIVVVFHEMNFPCRPFIYSCFVPTADIARDVRTLSTALDFR